MKAILMLKIVQIFQYPSVERLIEILTMFFQVEELYILISKMHLK